MPVAARRALATFFKNDLEDLEALVAEHARGPAAMKVVDCGRCHFFKRCNDTHCRPTFEERLAVIEEDERAWAAANQRRHELQQKRQQQLQSQMRREGSAIVDSDSDAALPSTSDDYFCTRLQSKGGRCDDELDSMIDEMMRGDASVDMVS